MCSDRLGYISFYDTQPTVHTTTTHDAPSEAATQTHAIPSYTL